MKPSHQMCLYGWPRHAYMMHEGRLPLTYMDGNVTRLTRLQPCAPRLQPYAPRLQRCASRLQPYLPRRRRPAYCARVPPHRGSWPATPRCHASRPLRSARRSARRPSGSSRGRHGGRRNPSWACTRRRRPTLSSSGASRPRHRGRRRVCRAPAPPRPRGMIRPRPRGVFRDAADLDGPASPRGRDRGDGSEGGVDRR